ncbi:DUF262 domain-containing protein [Burkholderia cenocepacia]|uniref:DUF262 domain-containing protein n=1 Tax=Burkholderia cenocepacia TaxID=95486 RepID=UPI00076BD05F|nr:DUF262 domain-containing protein [Burkholderia cenocepacia]KWU19139.1 hypothetical protein AS149_12895 [Burkholderia cenocepacia]
MRIEQKAGFLVDFVRDVSRGGLVPAAFQRPYVWRVPDVLALCNSIQEGFPIGSFLLWTPYGKADMTSVGRRRLGPIEVAGDNPHASMLLDGQNRLATLAWMMRDETVELPQDLSEAEDEVWGGSQRLVVDLSARSIDFVAKDEAAVGFKLPARVLLDRKVQMQLTRECWATSWAPLPEAEKDAGLKWLDEVTNTFYDARVVATSLEHASAAEAKRAFLHICKVGVPMSAADFDAAIAWAL